MLRFENLTKSFGNRTLFSDFTYELPDKGVVVIAGQSGSGKSTLLNMISGIDNNYDGLISLDGIEVKSLSDNESANFRMLNIGYVFQQFNLMNLDTVFQNVMFPLSASSNDSYLIKKKRVLDILKTLGIEKLQNKVVNKLSGGEKQRVAIARALVNHPKVILCDEPTGALDNKNSAAIYELLSYISTTTLVIIATHDVEEASKIADIVLRYKTNEIIEVLKKRIEREKRPLFINCFKTIKSPSLPVTYKVRYALQKNKTKKWRSLIMNMMLSLSLTGVGLSLIINESITNKINEAFSEILNGNQIVMSPKNFSPNGFTASYSASYDKINSIYEKYPDYFEGIGVNYLVNFEDFFKDKNEFIVDNGSKKFVLSSFSARNINDFKLIEDSAEIYYPSEPIELDDDEIVLGLTYQDVVNICFSLQIQRNFTSLGHYIYEHDLNLILSVKNSYWQYEDEQIFKIAAICESNSPIIYHTNQLFNEVVYEEKMRLPSDDNNEHDYPWEMEKIYYLKTINDPESFLDSSIDDNELDDFVFERTNSNYNPLLCNQGECLEKRIFAYYVDKNGIKTSDLKMIKKINPNIQNFYMTSNFGYSSYASNIFSGFSKNVFVSLDEHLINDAIDADTMINSDNSIQIDLPNGVIQGNYLNSLSNGLRFSTRMDSLIKGRKPKSNNEIVISRGLVNMLQTENAIGKYLYFAADIREDFDENNRVNKTYETTKIMIVGITDDENCYLYHDNNWTISFFRDKLGVSSFSLIPNGIVFEFADNINTIELTRILNENFKNYIFISPLETINDQIETTMGYANTILIAFSSLSIMISVLLLGTIIMLNIIESKNEIKLFSYLGVRNNEIKSLFIYQGLVQGFIAFLLSSLEMFFIDQIISYFLSMFLKIDFVFTLNIKPFIVIFVLAVLLPLFVSSFMASLLKKSYKNNKVFT